MKINFHKQPAIDFVLRLTLTIIIISPVIYFSGMPSKGRRGVIMSSVVLLLRLVFLVRELSLLVRLPRCYEKDGEE